MTLTPRQIDLKAKQVWYVTVTHQRNCQAKISLYRYKLDWMVLLLDD